MHFSIKKIFSKNTTSIKYLMPIDRLGTKLIEIELGLIFVYNLFPAVSAAIQKSKFCILVLSYDSRQ